MINRFAKQLAKQDAIERLEEEIEDLQCLIALDKEHIKDLQSGKIEPEALQQQRQNFNNN